MSNIPDSIIRARQKLITAHAINTLIQMDDEFVECLVLSLYRQQTPDEQIAKRTRHKNQMGLSACDAPLFTEIAGLIAAGHHPNAEHLLLLRRATRNGRSRLGHYQQQIRRCLIGGER